MSPHAAAPKSMTPTALPTTGPNLNSLLPWDQIRQPGAYVCLWDGCLLRVPQDGVTWSGPKLNFVGPEPLFVIKISDNPWITKTKARVLASNFDVNVWF